MLVPNPPGNYSFLKGIAPYSGGVIAHADHDIERVRLANPLPLPAAFALLDARLSSLGRPPQALCSMELRSPVPFSFQGFADFNGGYRQFLEKRGLLVDGLNPVARTNVAPEIGPPAEPVVYAFSYTIPAPGARRSFIVAGSGELPEGSLDPREIIRDGETSPDAMTEKARFVLDLMNARVLGLRVAWEDVHAVNVYTIHDISPFLASDLVPRAGNAPHGVVWHYTRPPITGIEYEMDVRGCNRDIVLGP